MPSNRVVNLIQVSMGSKRCPQKAVANICGRPALAHLIDRVRLTKRPVDTVICAAMEPEDFVLARIADIEKVKFMVGPNEDVLFRLLMAAHREDADHIVRITADDILVDPEHIDKAIDIHLETGADYTAWEGLPKGTEAEIISVRVMEQCYRMYGIAAHGEFFANCIKDSGHFRIERRVVDRKYFRPYSFEINTPADLNIVRGIFEQIYQLGKIFTLEELLQFIDHNPEALQRKFNLRIKE